MLLRRVRAETEGKEAETAKKQIDVEKEKVKLKRMQTNAVVDMLKTTRKLKNPKDKAAVRAVFYKNAESINPKISGLLPPPEN